MKKNVLIVLAHPQARSFCSALAEAYAAGAHGAGAQVRQLNLAEIDFNPIGSGSHAQPAALEPALGQKFQIQVAGERISIPATAIINIEHERGDSSEEVEFQLKWLLEK